MDVQIQLTNNQVHALKELTAFTQQSEKKIFILKGYAGTGKTTLMKKLIQYLNEREKQFVLLASTGRAAKILSNITKRSASTIHHKIYKFSDINQDLNDVVNEIDSTGVDKSGQLLLNFELVPRTSSTSTIYIVDESSMISDDFANNNSQAFCGSGKLLTDLLTYDNKGKFIFVGDTCQLPPVGQSISPALSPQYFAENFNLEAQEVELKEIMRQAQGNDIILATKKIRKLYHECPQQKWAKFPLRNYRNITLFPTPIPQLTDYVERIRKMGYNEATLICRSNKSCAYYNKTIRAMLGIMSNNVQKGDLLLITQNNYISDLMNGDLVVVEDTFHRESKAGMSFLLVKVKELFSQQTYTQFLIEDNVYCGMTNLTSVQQKNLYFDFYRRMRDKGMKQKDELFKESMYKDPYLNALHAVWGFAITCHKAQGGEWQHVYIDIPKNFSFNAQRGTYQWLYTALTRAKEQLYLVDDFWIV